MCELANRAIRNPDETNQRRCTGYTAMPQARGTQRVLVEGAKSAAAKIEAEGPHNPRQRNDSRG